MTIEVITGEIMDAAAKLKAAATGVEGADPSGDLGGVAGAMPGSQSASAVGRLTSAWEQRFSGWHTDAMDEHGGLVASAQSYDAADLAADRAARNAEARLGPIR